MVVAGSGQAACQAATAASRAGAKTLLLVSDLDTIARLGIKHLLEREPNLDLRQSIVVAVNVAKAKARGVSTKFGERFDAKAVIFGLEIGEPVSSELMENLKKVDLKIGSATSTMKEEKVLSSKKEIKGFRPGRRVEYHCLLPNQLKPSFETEHIAGLYFVGSLAGAQNEKEAILQGTTAVLSVTSKI